ncbi:Hypothetical protein I595_598 [Croceitalea dokdonensis DOKDO 023]|uniref:Impact N-terminal domain-containing protein n=1 Tax=Croceitalea dokdonensis DOKDO 023 TaxID=1300341 RepID=A0A0N8H4L3_9FLAO|nr:YigZ family protein [Croceitalea dokdonensis]KPM33692.1 Hypothetical protein I595_598 [Croceitalea dokdonensis DOKDO 023]
MEKDSYRTIAQASQEILYKNRKSKFYGYAYPITKEHQVKPIIEDLRKRHPTAGHVCFAWQLGVNTVTYRTNDDGEPNNSAGMPIYGQIKAFGYTNILVAVPRIYGGTKLGVGGLIQAYKTAAQLALDQGVPIERYIKAQFKLSFDYALMDKVMRLIKQLNLTIDQQKLELSCELLVGTRKRNEEKVMAAFRELHGVNCKKVAD